MGHTEINYSLSLKTTLDCVAYILLGNPKLV